MVVEPTGSPAPTAAPATEAPASPELVEGAIGGWWRVQETPQAEAPASLATALDRRQFTVYHLEPACADEPCDRVRVTVLLPTYSVTLAEYRLTRKGRLYAASQVARTTGPCETPDGTSVPAGATVTERVRLWLEQVRRAGTAVTSTQLRGEIVVEGAPTRAGETAGCEAWEARYALAGEPTGAPAVSGGGAAPTQPPGTVMADLPDIRPKIKGATVDTFSVRGSTVSALIESVARGGVKACGRINYEWYSGDTRPSGCMQSDWDTFAVVRVPAGNGSCHIDVRRISLAITVELPRWTAPDRVPKALAAWWRRIVDHIRDHEAGHVSIARKAVAKLPGLLDGKACSKLEPILAKWAASLNRAQEAYDAREYEMPWPVPPAGL